jgi:hypothetical protein
MGLHRNLVGLTRSQQVTEAAVQLIIFLFYVHRKEGMSPLGGLLSEVLRLHTCTRTRRAKTGTTRTHTSTSTGSFLVPQPCSSARY